MTAHRPTEPAIAAALAAGTLPPAIVTWLAKLRLLQGVPFNYLVSDPRLLPPESIKFFRLDPAWATALVDGALSVGRNYSAAGAPSPDLIAEQVHRPRLDDDAAQATPGIRRQQLKQEPDASALAPLSVDGFLLRSQVVSGWKSLDVIGYARGSSPYDYEQGAIGADQVQALDILRLERLAPTVLLGLFHGALYQLVLHQPPEAVHFGFQTQRPGSDRVTKDLRAPATSWDDRAATYEPLPDRTLDGVFANAARRVVDLTRLSRAIAATLDTAGKAPGYYQAAPDADHQNHLVSSDFALEMVHGVGLVSYINHALPSQDAR